MRTTESGYPVCGRCDGPWGTDITCLWCTDEDGGPRPIRKERTMTMPPEKDYPCVCGYVFAARWEREDHWNTADDGREHGQPRSTASLCGNREPHERHAISPGHDIAAFPPLECPGIPAPGGTRRAQESVCAAHIPSYARDGRLLQQSSAPCTVCGEPSAVILPAITSADRTPENIIADAIRQDAEEQQMTIPELADHIMRELQLNGFAVEDALEPVHGEDITEGAGPDDTCGCGEPITMYDGVWLHIYNPELRGTDDHDARPGSELLP